MRIVSRRQLMVAAAVSSAFPFAAYAQTPKALSDLAEAAAKKPPVVWTESSEVAAAAKIIAAFNRQYPGIKVEYIRDTGGNTLAAKVVQQVQAGGQPAAVLTGDQAQFVELDKRGLVRKPDWAALGVAKELIGSPYMVATTAAIGMVVWNKSKVSDAEAPKSLEALAEPKWKGKAGSWIRAPHYAQLGKVMGADKIRDVVSRLVANEARLYDSTFRIGQELATGEIDVGYSFFHATQPALAAGAPIGYAFVDPVPVSTIYSTVVEKSANPEGGVVLVAWLATKEGADAYEAATNRGNPYVKGTRSAGLVAGRKISEYPLSELDTYVKLQAELNKILSARGAAKK
jgi:iron(III) transport system substrate-binding protein